MSVIIGRALPDVRDGLKPAHRRVLYGMRTMGLASNRAYRKCAKIVGEVMGNYHPHGDASIYDTLVRLAQDFNMRYPLVDGQGNFGSIDGDPPAAMRYTEARPEAHRRSDDDGPRQGDRRLRPQLRRDAPKSRPFSRRAFPNLLVNGSAGIAVGMATNMPPHNLREVIDGVIAADRAARPVAGRPAQGRPAWPCPGPDFPSGGFIVGPPRDLPGLHHRPRRDHDARARGRRGEQEGRQAVDRHHRDSVSDQQGAADREDRRARAREDDRGDRGPARRVRSRRHADRHRAEARRRCPTSC